MPVLLGLAPIIVALLIILVALAVWVLAELLARALGAIPVAGGWIGSHVRDYADAAGRYIMVTWDLSTAALGWAVQTVVWHVWHSLYSAGLAIEHAVKLGAKAEQDVSGLAAELPQAVNAGVATAVGAAEAYAARAVAGVLADAEGLYNKAVSVAAADAAGVLSQAEGLFNQVEHDLAVLDAIRAAAENVISGRLSALEAAVAGDVSALVGQIQGDLNVAVATAEADAAAALAAANRAAVTIATELATTAVAGLDQAAHDLVIGPWQALLPELEILVGALPLPEVQALGLPGVLTPTLPLSIPGILATLTPAIAALLSEVTTCVTPNCGPIKELGSLMNGLEKVGLAGLLFALVAGAIADPHAAADDIVASLGWAGDLSTEFVSAVMG